MDDPVPISRRRHGCACRDFHLYRSCPAKRRVGFQLYLWQGVGIDKACNRIIVFWKTVIRACDDNRFRYISRQLDCAVRSIGAPLAGGIACFYLEGVFIAGTDSSNSVASCIAGYDAGQGAVLVNPVAGDRHATSCGGPAQGHVAAGNSCGQPVAFCPDGGRGIRYFFINLISVDDLPAGLNGSQGQQVAVNANNLVIAYSGYFLSYIIVSRPGVV